MTSTTQHPSADQLPTLGGFATVAELPPPVSAANNDPPADALTSSELAALPGVLDVITAARVLGIGRTMAYELVRTDQWPTPVLRVGRLVKIPTAPLLALLGITGHGTTQRS